MAKVKGRIIDRNRYTKKYSLRRAPQRLTYIGNTDFSIELGSLTFNNEDQKTFKFESAFPNDNYTVIAMPRDTASSADGSANVSLYIDNATFSRDSVLIKASMAFTGVVDVIAVKVG
tara:strand:+ start:126 stop:476 length:351 start_codon:yes stop_codon:yes gene_type:complete